MFHLAESLDFLDVISEEQHQILLFELDDLLSHLFPEFDVGIDQNWNFATFFSQVVDHFLDSLLSHFDSGITLSS
jgi:hypothetical protein